MSNHGVEQGVKEVEPHEALEVRTFGEADESGVLDLLQAAFGNGRPISRALIPRSSFVGRWHARSVRRYRSSQRQKGG